MKKVYAFYLFFYNYVNDVQSFYFFCVLDLSWLLYALQLFFFLEINILYPLQKKKILQVEN